MEVELDDSKIPPETSMWGSEEGGLDQELRSWGLTL